MKGTERSIEELELLFKSGRKPTEEDFQDLLASYIHRSEGDFNGLMIRLRDIENFLASFDLTVTPTLSCDNGSARFSIMSVTPVDGGLRMHFDAANLHSATYVIRLKSNNVIFDQGDISNINANPFTFSTKALPTNNYILEVTGKSCIGTATKDFSTVRQLASPVISVQFAPLNTTASITLTEPGNLVVYVDDEETETLTNKSGSFDYTFSVAGQVTFVLIAAIDGAFSQRSNSVTVGATTSNDAYAIPSFSSGAPQYYDSERNQFTVFYMKLQAVKSNNKYIITDLAADEYNRPSGYVVKVWRSHDGGTEKFYYHGVVVKHNNQWYYAKYDNTNQEPGLSGAWQLTNIEKLYWIGTPGSDRSLAYTVSQLKNGIDVTAYRGTEIIVMAGFIADNNNILDWSQQLVYIPEGPPVETYQGGLYVHYPASKTFVQTNRDLRFNHYLTSANFKKPAGHVIACDLSNALETSGGTSFQNLGIHSRYSTAPNFIYEHLLDGWWQHPDLNAPTTGQAAFDAWWASFKNSKGSLTAAVNALRSTFKSQIIDPNAHLSYAFLNNELSYHMARNNPETRAALAACYADWKVHNTGMLVAWNDSTFDVNFAIPVNKNAAFADYNMTGTLNDIAANAQWIKAAPVGSLEYELSISNNGEYFNDPLSDRSTYVAIIQSIFNKKFNPTQKNVITTWRTLESLRERMVLSYQFVTYKGRPVRAVSKAAASPHSLRNMGVVAAFFADGGHPWDDGLTAISEGVSFYPYGGASFFLDGNQEEVPFTSSESVHTVNPTINLDSFFDGMACVYEHGNLLSGGLLFADLNDGSGWRTGADAFVVGAWVDKKPFAAYRRLGNEYLVVAFNNYSRVTQNIQIRMKDANNADVIKTVRVDADKMTVVKF